MNTVLGQAEPRPAEIAESDLRFLHIMLGLQIVLGLLWGVSMLFFARQIVLGAVVMARTSRRSPWRARPT